MTDITQTAGAATLLESMPTRLFLANPDFPEAGQTTFQLNDDELRTVRELEPKRELYLLRPSRKRANPVMSTTCDDLITALGNFHGLGDGPRPLFCTIRSVSRPPKWDSKTAVAARIAVGT